MAGILTDPRAPSKIPADMYVCWSVAEPNSIMKDTPFSRSLYRKCKNAHAAIVRSMKAGKRTLGEAIVSKDRIIRDGRVKGQRHFDAYIAHIPIRQNCLEEEATKPVLVKALDSMKRAVVERGYNVRVVCLGDIHQHISNNDAFEVGLYVEKIYRSLGEDVRMVVSLGTHNENPNNRTGPNYCDMYGWVRRV